jgi:hypothetical protein
MGGDPPVLLTENYNDINIAMINQGCEERTCSKYSWLETSWPWYIEYRGLPCAQRGENRSRRVIPRHTSSPGLL